MNRRLSAPASPSGARIDADFLAGGGVEVWVARVTAEASRPGGAGVHDVLSGDERARAARFRVDDVRGRFVTGRTVLRRLAGAFLGVSPAEVELEIGARGKPALSPAHASWLRFNIAHSGDIVLVAFALGADVGVDIELRRTLSDRDALITRYFAPAERDALMRIPDVRRTDAFFDCWARKEALVKAWASGLALALDAFAVPVDPAPDSSPFCCAHPRGAGEWWLWDLDVDSRYAAAVAVRRSHAPERVALRHWGEAKPGTPR